MTSMPRSSWLAAPRFSAVLLLASLVGCSSANENTSGGGKDAAADGYKYVQDASAGNYDVAQDRWTAPDGDSVEAGPPEESDVNEFYTSPVATGRYVWVANPTSGRVAYVDSATATVRTAEAGAGPTYLAAVPPGDTVLVLNVGSHDANLLRVTDTGISSRTIPGMPERANAWAVSPDGRWAVSYTDVRRVKGIDAVSPLEGFQEVSVIDLAATQPAVRSFAVGYRPRQVVFSADLKHGFAVTDDGVSVFALPVAPTRPVERTVAVEVVADEDPAQREVLITRDGAWALARSEGSAKVLFVNLTTGESTPIELSGPVSDLDLNSATDRAVAVVKATSEVAIFPVPGAVSAPTSVVRLILPDSRIGQAVLADANPDVAVLFTRPSSGPLVSQLTELRIADGLYRSIRLAAGVDSVMLAPDGGHAVAIHKQTVWPDGGGTARMLYGFSVVPLDPSLPPTPHETNAPITSVAFGAATVPSGGEEEGGSGGSTAGASRALLTVSDPVHQVYGAYLARFAAGTARRFSLASPPIQVGTVNSGAKAYVVQQHPEGRISLISFEDEQSRTVTGFELASAIINGNP